MAAAEEANQHRVYCTQFVDYVKYNGTKISRLCIATYKDHGHSLFTAAPTIKGISLRLLLAISTTEKLPLPAQAVMEVFLVSKTLLCRTIRMTSPAKVKLKNGTLLKVVKPVYAMPESPIHWYNTFTDYHWRTLGMNSTTLAHCLMFKMEKDSLEEIVSINVDDKNEDKKSRELPSKGKDVAEKGRQSLIV